MISITTRYTSRTDPIARHQLARLMREPHNGPRKPASRSRWGHVPIADLFAAAGNRLHVRGSGRIETGHEPIHGSKGGHCVTIDPTTGLWYCRSCRTGGDAARYVRQLRGCTYAEAARWLTERYGIPTGAKRPQRRILEA